MERERPLVKPQAQALREGLCPHRLVTWQQVPHPRYGDRVPAFVRVDQRCQVDRSHVRYDVPHAVAGRAWR